MEEQLQRVHAGRDMPGRRRHEGGVAGARAADPVLAGAELAGVFAAAAALRQQFGVYLAEQAQGERKALAQALEPVVHGRDVVADFANVVDRYAGLLVEFEKQEVREGGLRAFDHRGEDRLFADIGVEEEGHVRQQGRDAVEAAESQQGVVEPFAQGGRPDDRRRRREVGRDEGPGLLADGRDRLVTALECSLHRVRSSNSCSMCYSITH